MKITAYIGIGSNIGDRRRRCLDAIDRLRGRGIEVTKVSSLYETEPWGVKDQPEFINMVIEIKTHLNPHELLHALKETEMKMGREEIRRWGPRVIDLDILLYGELIIREENLTIPHPHMLDRDFVLRPLTEIAPDIVHPLVKKSMRELLQ